jgi:hypothetical protein
LSSRTPSHRGAKYVPTSSPKAIIFLNTSKITSLFLCSLTELLQVAEDNGAKRALSPIENKRNFFDAGADIVDHVDPIFFGHPKTAAGKVTGG